jgi:hypothetical protein
MGRLRHGKMKWLADSHTDGRGEGRIRIWPGIQLKNKGRQSCRSPPRLGSQRNGKWGACLVIYCSAWLYSEYQRENKTAELWTPRQKMYQRSPMLLVSPRPEGLCRFTPTPIWFNNHPSLQHQVDCLLEDLKFAAYNLLQKFSMKMFFQTSF